MNPRVMGLGTAVPPNELSQGNARDFARRFFSETFADIDRLLTVFDHTTIERRYTACALEWFERPNTFATKNSIYRDTALDLSERAAREAIAASGVDRSAIGALVFVSTTGVAAPSLDSHLVQRLDLPRSLARFPVWGLGCAGGGGGLARAAMLARALQNPVLLVSVELCSVTFVHSDRSKSNLIATALFGDGAAAAVVGYEGDGPELLGEHSHLFDDTEHVMGWDVTDAGFEVRFARTIPLIVRRHMGELAAAAARSAGLGAALEHYVLPPGGAKVLEAYAEGLRVDPERLSSAWEILRDFGNMSSPTVLFVLERFLATTPRKDAPGLLMGLGPGFCAEGVVFRW